MASLDFDTEKLVALPVNPPQSFIGSNSQPDWSPDGKKIYYVRGSSKETTLIERELAAGSERKLVRGWVRIPCVLPDGRHVAWPSFGPDKSEAVLLVPLAGGAPRELLRTKGSESVTMALTSTPDGRGLLVQKGLSSGGNELLLVPVGGGQPRKLDDRINSLPAQIRIHPDGRQIAWVAGQSKQEVWVLENFLPAK